MSILTVKGRSHEKIEIMVNNNVEFDSILSELTLRMEKMKSFIGDYAPQCQIAGREFTPDERQKLSALLKNQFGISKLFFAKKKEEKPEKREKAKQTQPPEEEKQNNISGEMADQRENIQYFDAKSIFVRKTVRSGQRLECEGDIVVLGDVNPGAELIAGGNIAVMGTLRGLAHAGATGRSDVIITAINLRPKQLRISSKITIFPDEDSDFPEYAALFEDKIVINRV